jgi:hypothetical protein
MLFIALFALSFNVFASKVSVIDLEFNSKDIINLTAYAPAAYSDNNSTIKSIFRHGDAMTAIISDISSNATIDKYKISSEDDLIEAINTAINPENPHPSKIINISLVSAGECSPAIQETITHAKKAGTIIVISAGNSPSPYLTGIAKCTDAIIVGASNPETDVTSDFSNFAGKIDIFAPEFGRLNSKQERLGHGTSFSAAMVAGIAAELSDIYPNIDLDTLKTMLNYMCVHKKHINTALEITALNSFKNAQQSK